MERVMKSVSSGSEQSVTATQNYDNRYQDIVSRPHLVFAHDFIYSFCCEFNVNWLPPGYDRYEIHPRSPVTTEVRQAALIVLKHNIRDYETISGQVLHGDMDRLEAFSEYIISIFSYFKEGYYLSIRDVFVQLVFIARLSIQLCNRGATLAPSICAIVLSKEMHQLNKRCCGLIFHLFSVFSTGVIEGHGYQSLSKENLKLSL